MKKIFLALPTQIFFGSKELWLLRFFIGILLVIITGEVEAQCVSPVIDNNPGTRSFTVPIGVTEITVEVWGGGGRGGSRTSVSGAYGGGGGGGYSRSTISVTPGQTFTYAVGAGSTNNSNNGGNSWFSSTNEGASIVRALGGNSVPNNGANGATGGATGTGQITFAGGDGANGNGTTNGGGGGGSAGPDGNGGNASGSSGGNGLSVGGNNGGNGATANNSNGFLGNTPGAGGGGARRNSSGSPTGGNGGNGQIRISFDCPCSEIFTAGTSTFTVPLGVTEITVEAWGGGGRGGTRSGSNGATGGGGGGAYSRSVLSVTPGQTYTYIVGEGSNSTAPGGTSRFYLISSTDLVRALGGNSVGDNTTGGAGGLASGGIGDVTFSGGSGANAVSPTNNSRRGGGGGGAGGALGDGADGSNRFGGSNQNGGGDGGTANNSNNSDGNPGSIIGGGGSGAARGTGTRNGGPGADGEIRITYIQTPTISDPSNTNPICINTIMTPVTQATAGVTGIESVSGLPPGVIATWLNNTLTISGTPTSLAGSPYNYSITLNSGCSPPVTVTGSLVVLPRPTPAFTAQPSGSFCPGTSVTYTTEAGNTNYQWNIPGTAGADYTITAGGTGTGSNTVTLTWLTPGSKTVTVNYTNSNGCASVVPASNTVTITPSKSASAPAVTTVCAVSGNPNITQSTQGVTGIGTATGLPPGVTATFSSGTGNITIAGNPTQLGTFNYSIPLVGGCGPDAFATGTIIVQNCACEDIFTSNGTFTIPNGVTQIVVEAWGGGGAGGGSANNSGTRRGGGGGGGAYSTIPISVAPGQELTMNVGQGGSGANDANGGNGGNSTVIRAGTTLIQANGGAGGIANGNGGAGGNGGIGSITAGGNGGNGGTGTGSSGSGGNGGNGGNGGPGISSGTFNGNPGETPGGGGSGARGTSSNGQRAGGNGGDGQIRITYTLTAGVISGPQGVCLGGTTAFASTMTGGTWSSSNEAVATVNPTTGVITGVGVGVASIRYTIVGTCAIATSSRTVFVNQPINPGVLNGVQEICIGSTSQFTSTTTNGTWTSSNPTIASVSNTGLVTGLSAGTATISYTLPSSGGCPPSVATRTITISTPPDAGVLIGTQEICTGETTTFSSSSPGGTWVSSNIAVATVNPTTGEVTGIGQGTATLTYTVFGTGGCSNASATRTVSVTNPPNAGVLSGSIELCVGENSVFSSSVAGGTWSSSNDAIVTVNISTGEVFAVAAGTATISYTVAGSGGCSDAIASRNITVSDLPIPTFIEAPTTDVCMGTAVTYTTQSDQFDYDWHIDGVEGDDYTISSGGADENSNTVTIIWLSDGTKEVSVNYFNENGCTSTNPISASINVNPLPEILFTVEPSNPICIGDEVVYATESGQSSYNWIISGVENNDFIISGGDINSHTIILSWLTNGSKTVTVNYTNVNGCTSTSPASNTIDIEPLPVPTFTTEPSNPVCIGESVVYTTQSGYSNYSWTILGTEGVDYVITAGSIGTSSHTVSIQWLTNGPKTVSVNYQDDNGCSGVNPASNTITIDPLPVPTFTTEPSNPVCIGEEVTYTTESGFSNYSWTVSGTEGTDYTITDGGIGTSSNTISIQWLTDGIKTVSVNYQDVNGCTGVNPAFNTIDIDPLPTPSFIAEPSNPVCIGDMATYTTTPSQSNYIWTVSGNEGTDYTITDGSLGTSSNTVTIQWLTDGNKTVSVNFENANGCSGLSSATNTITIDPLPVPTFTAEPSDPVCLGEIVTYTTQSGFFNYAWSVSGTSGTDYEITAGSIGTSSNTVTIQWLTDGIKTVSVNYQDGNGCSGVNSATSIIDIEPLPVPTFTTQPSNPVCIGEEVTYTTQSGFFNYTWSVSGTEGSDYEITAGGIANSDFTVTIVWLTGGEKSVTVNYQDVSGCQGINPASNSIIISIPASIITQPDTGIQVECSGDGFDPIFVSAVGSNVSYQWYSKPDDSDISTNPGTPVTGATNASFTPPSDTEGEAFYYVVISNECNSETSSLSGRFIVTEGFTFIDQQPSTIDETICFGDTFTEVLTVNGFGDDPTDPITYQWYRNSLPQNFGGDLLSGQTSASITPLSDASSIGTFYYYARVSSDCGTVPTEVSGAFTINPVTSIDIEDFEGNIICEDNGPFTPISVEASGTGTLSFQWYTNTTGVIDTSIDTQVGANSNSFTPPSNNPDGTARYYYVVVSSTDGCGPDQTSNISGAFIVNPNNTASAPSSTPTVCINTPIPTITHSTTSATGIGTPAGLPVGVDASWSAGVITISGTPTEAGTFNYTIPLTGGCGTVTATGTITVTPNMTVTSTQPDATVCINEALSPLNHTTSLATGIGTPTGLPTGVTASWTAGVISISGTPTEAGTFNYTIPLTGGCGDVSATGSITVTPNMTATSAQPDGTVCINEALSPINHSTTLATGIGTPTGLPTGLTANWVAEVITISGIPTESGTFNYTIPLTGGCGDISAAGTITVTPNMTSTSAQPDGTVCINEALSPINHSTTLATGIGTPTGLPAGVTANWAGDMITISGTPTVAGTFNYTIPLTGGCGTVAATGAITVTPTMTVTSAQPNGTVCINEALSLINHSTTLATGIGTPTGLPPGVTANWSSNVISISGTPSISGTFNYSIPLTGGCGDVSASGTITVTPTMTVTSAEANGTVCINEALAPINHTTTLATGIGTPTGLPTGVTANWAGDVITISGSPTIAGTFNYAIPLIGGCGSITATGTITVTPDMTVSSAQANGSVCLNQSLTAITHNTTQATGIGTPTGLPAGVTANWASNVITIAGTPSVSGTFNYSIPLTGGCGTVSAIGTIIVNPNPEITAINAAPICSGDTFSVIPVNGTNGLVPSGTRYTWTVANNPNVTGETNQGIPQTEISQTLVNTTLTNQTVIYTVTPISPEGCSGNTFTVTVVVRPVPTVNPISNQAPVCGGTPSTAVNFTGNGVSGVVYNWTNNNPSIGLPASGTGNIPSFITENSGPSPITATITVTPTVNGCAGPSQSFTITVNPTPIVSLLTDYCSVAGGVELVVNSSVPGTTWLWNTGATTSSIVVNTAGFFSVTGTSPNGCTATASVSVAEELVVDGSFTNFDPANPSFFTEYLQNQAYWDQPPPYNWAIPKGLHPDGRYAVNENAWYNFASGVLNGYHPNFHGRDHTNNSVGPRNFMMVNGGQLIGNPPRQPIIWEQTVNVEPNTEYYFSAWAMNLNPGSPARLQFEINGVLVGTVLDLNDAPKPTSPAEVNLDNWRQFYSDPTWSSGDATTATIRIVNLNTDAGGNDFGLDDISFGTLSSFIQLISAEGTDDSQVVCEDSPIVDIEYRVGGGLAGPVVENLPPGVTSVWNGVNLRFSGSPTQAGTYEYTIFTTGACLQVRATGVIVVRDTPDEGVLASDETVCFGEMPSEITGDVYLPQETGATITYRWEMNSNFSSPSWTNVPGNPSGANYNPPILSESTQYRRYTISTVNGLSCEGPPSDPVTITIQSEPTPGSIATDQELCEGGDPAPFTSLQAGTGDGTISYQWESAVSPFDTWTSIPGADQATYDAPAGITATTRYRRITLSTLNGVICESAPTTPVQITVTPANTVIPVEPDQILCVDTAFPSTIIHNTTGATGIVAQSPTVNYNLPNGVTASWNAGVITIQGTPTESGVFDYNIPLAGGCGEVSATGTITVGNPSYPISSIQVVNPQPGDPLPATSTFTIFSPGLTTGTYTLIYSTSGTNQGPDRTITATVTTAGQLTFSTLPYADEGTTILTILSIQKNTDLCPFFPPNNNSGPYGINCSSEFLKDNGDRAFFVPANVFEVNVQVFGDGVGGNTDTRTIAVSPGNAIYAVFSGDDVFATLVPPSEPLAVRLAQAIAQTTGPNGRILFLHDCPTVNPCNSGPGNVIQYTDSEGYTILKFSMPCADYTWNAPDGLDEFEVLVVGGGGGGGYGVSAGGGGGGGVIYRHYTDIRMGALVGLQNASFTISVGEKGLGSTTNSASGGDGEGSSFVGSAFTYAGSPFTNLNAAGGGGGGSTYPNSSISSGAHGASGGGGAAYSDTQFNGGIGGLGNNGASGMSQSPGASGGGGGGASTQGSSGNYNSSIQTTTGGLGGQGESRTISGEQIWYGAGGGGTSSGGITNIPGAGGSQYTGPSSTPINAGGNANNQGIGFFGTTFGSGGGAGILGGGDGFTGVVYIRYPNFRILPVEYLYFRATYNSFARSGDLSWATLKEWENDRFEIERAVNNVQDWVTLGELSGAGYTDTLHEYFFQDTNLPLSGGNVFYRLKQFDFSGQYLYSDIRAIKVEALPGTTYWRVYPNPTNGNQVNLEMMDNGIYNDELIKIRVINATGNFEVFEGRSYHLLSNQISKSIEEKAAGVYVFEISWGTFKEYHKVVVKR